MATYSLSFISLGILVNLVCAGTTLAQDYQPRVYCVSPDPRKCNNTEGCNKCDTLMNFVANVTAYFTSNTKLVFLPGVHHLNDNTTVSVSNVESLTLVGCDSQVNGTLCNENEPPEILCNNTGGFKFESITNLKIEKLAITRCGWEPPKKDYPMMVALLFNNTFDISLIQLTVQNSTGYGILAYRPFGTSQIIDCLFQYNKGTQDHAGGNVYFAFSGCLVHKQNSMTIKSSRFLYGKHGQNNATNYAAGLTIHLTCNNTIINVDNVTMIENEAEYCDPTLNLKKLGGSGNMAMVYETTRCFANKVTITNSYFIGGRGVLGGGLYVSFINEPRSMLNLTEYDCSSWLLIDNTSFIGNFAIHDGGGIHFHFSCDNTHRICQNIKFTVNNSRFHNNTVGRGGGNMAMVYKTFANKVTITNSYFIGGRGVLGGGLYVSFINEPRSMLNLTEYDCSSWLLIDNTSFIGNFAIRDGGGIYFNFSRDNTPRICQNIKFTVNNSRFHNNTVGRGGGNMAMVYKTFANKVTITNSYFIGGRGVLGGGLYVSFINEPRSMLNLTEYDCSSWLLIDNTSFIGNFAIRDGGGIYFNFSRDNTPRICQNIKFTVNNSRFHNNTVGLKNNSQFNVGVAVSVANYYDWGFFSNLYTKVTTTIFNCTFKNNGLNNNIIDLKYARYSGSAVFYASQQIGTTVLQNCSFESNNVTAISVFRSHVTFQGVINIVDNHGLDGGGLLLCETSYMILKPNTTVTIANNTAQSKGGGIFTESRCSQSEPLCFFQIDSEKDSNAVYNTINVKLINNTAQYAGNQLYGGTIDRCYLKYFPVVRGRDLFDKLFPNSSHQPSDITSDPQNVCFCMEGKPNCSIKEWYIHHSVSPGQTFNVSVATVGQMDGTAPGYVFTHFINHTNDHDKLGYRQVSQYVYRHCTTIHYTIYSHPGNKSLALSVVNPYYNNTLYFESRNLYVTVKPCPLGFQVKKVFKLNCKCIDQPDIYHFGFKCNIQNKSIHRPAPAWIGYHFANKTSIKNTVDGVIYHRVCPFDFCRGGDVNISVNSTHFDQDSQCAFNRTGMLCGACRNGTSIAIGSTACLNCTGTKPIQIFGHVLLFLFGGIFLVAFLFTCNFTVTEGTISGLLFYVNIFEITHYTFLPIRNLPWYGKVLAVFVSSLNFNEGIESCFYDGMNNYAKIWFHFVFSIYIFVIAGLIVYLSKRYSRIANLIGNNSVQVLATLFLLSYTKIILGVTEALSFTTVTYPAPNESTVNQNVWLYDGTIEYLHGKHIPLFIVSVGFGVFALFYTFLLLFIQPLERFSNYKCLKWVAMLKPLVDAYSSPHIIKEKYRFWNGLLLLFRFIFVALAVSMTNNPQLYLTTVTTTCILIISIAWSLGGIYKKWSLNLLTASFFLNLAFLSVSATYNINTYEGHVRYRLTNCSFISLSIAALTFIGILMYHIYKQSTKWKCCNKLHARLEQISIFRNSIRHQRMLTAVGSASEALEETEPLIGNNKSINYTESEEYRQAQLDDFEPDTY